MITITLKPGRDGAVRAGHPWIFSGAIQQIDGRAQAGGLARVRAADGTLLGVGYHHPRCSIAVRMLVNADEPINGAFLAKRLASALRLRHTLLPPATTAYRLVNGEGDFLPGLIVDVYDRFLVCQFLTAGMEAFKPMIVEQLVALLSPRGIYEKSEGNVRQEEGLANSAGTLWGEEPPKTITIQEQGCSFLVDPKGGQKTGFFLDQRDNRALVRTLSAGRRVLNGFAYTGGFGIFAAKGGAQYVLSVDSSAAALQLARQNWEGNALSNTQGDFLQADMFTYLRDLTEPFDLMILDPPPFARRRQDLRSGLTGYKEINVQALRKLSPGGHLLTFSCSQHVSSADFVQTVAFAAADTKRPVQLLRQLGPAGDHPVNIVHSEGSYLKGVWLRMGD